MNNIYYVYAYLRSKDSKTAKAGTPYYIGKGKKDRAFAKHFGITIPSNKSFIILIETNLTDVGALALERRLIQWWGRKDLNTGILLNQTSGGEGASGTIRTKEWKDKLSKNQIGKIVSEETKSKISKANKGKKRTDEDRKKMSQLRIGKSHLSIEARASISKKVSGKNSGMYGHIYTIEDRERMSKARLGIKRGPYKKRIKL